MYTDKVWIDTVLCESVIICYAWKALFFEGIRWNIVLILGTIKPTKLDHKVHKIVFISIQYWKEFLSSDFSPFEYNGLWSIKHMYLNKISECWIFNLQLKEWYFKLYLLFPNGSLLFSHVCISIKKPKSSNVCHRYCFHFSWFYRILMDSC